MPASSALDGAHEPGDHQLHRRMDYYPNIGIAALLRRRTQLRAKRPAMQLLSVRDPVRGA